MVIGAMGLRDTTPLVIIQGNIDAARYRNEIIIIYVLPLMNKMPNQARGPPSLGSRETIST